MKTINKVILQHTGFKFKQDEQVVSDYALSENIEVVKASIKDVSKSKLKVSANALPVGDLKFMKAAADQVAIDFGEWDDCPDVLTSYYHRNIRKGLLLKDVSNIEKPVFIKPYGHLKKFTGFVLRQEYSAAIQLQGVSKNTPIIVSELVEFVSEWRLYVDSTSSFTMGCYSGDVTVRPELNVCKDMISLLGDTLGKMGYALDVGVLATGQTAVVEVNPGMSIGYYEGAEKSGYYSCLRSYWKYHWVNSRKVL